MHHHVARRRAHARTRERTRCRPCATLARASHSHLDLVYLAQERMVFDGARQASVLRRSIEPKEQRRRSLRAASRSRAATRTARAAVVLVVAAAHTTPCTRGAPTKRETTTVVQSMSFKQSCSGGPGSMIVWLGRLRARCCSEKSTSQVIALSRSQPQCCSSNTTLSRTTASS